MRIQPEKGALLRPFLWTVVALVAASAPFAARAADCSPVGVRHRAHVRYVIDGDTVILDGGRHIRIVGLNAPEIGHDGAPDQPFARAARDRLIALLANAHGRIVWSTAPDRRDHYGRTLAHVYIDGRDAAALLLKAGLAAVIAIPPNVRRSACYDAAEGVARGAHRGLWSRTAAVVRGGDVAATGFQIVRGHVARVSVKHAGTLLTLAGGLDIWIPAADRPFFRRPPKRLDGHEVLVRGWLHDYHGRPEITVRHPAVLTMLDGAAPASGY
ncbi:MAG TPA: thermonuclease family protein [Gammaproteobacteria bacterium]|nr:thermonuclease family protein [Gammaproteobacteria bacterium]